MKKEETPQQQSQVPSQIPIDGFKQVLEMLQMADPAFRESLLKRLAQKDRQLAGSLRQDLAEMGLL